MWAELRNERDRVWQRPAKAETGEKADDEEAGNVLGEDGGERAETESGGAEDDDALAPDAVGDRTEEERADHIPQEAGAEDWSQRAASEAPVVGKSRRDIADPLRVEAVEEEHGGAGEQQPNLKAANRLLVDEGGNVGHAGRARALGSLCHESTHLISLFAWQRNCPT